MARRPEKPVPNATSTRPGASATSAAVAAAFTMGCRSEGTSTPGPEADAGGALRREGEGHPHVGTVLRGVVEPRPRVPQLLRQRDVHVRVQRRRKGDRDLHGLLLGTLRAPMHAAPTVGR